MCSQSHVWNTKADTHPQYVRLLRKYDDMFEGKLSLDTANNMVDE